MAGKSLEVGVSPAGQGRSRRAQFPVPGNQLAIIRSLLQGGIALAQGTTVTTGNGKKSVFHVEQAPIQQTSAVDAATRNQLVSTGVEANHRAVPQYLSHAVRGFLVHTPLPGSRITNQSNPIFTGADMSIGSHHHSASAVLHKDFRLAVTEAACMRKQISRFEHTGFSGAVGAMEKVESRCQQYILRSDVAQPLNVEMGKMQVVCGPPIRDDYNRSGMTTCRERSLAGARNRQLEFASRKHSRTSSPCKALSASCK